MQPASAALLLAGSRWSPVQAGLTGAFRDAASDIGPLTSNRGRTELHSSTTDHTGKAFTGTLLLCKPQLRAAGQ